MVYRLVKPTPADKALATIRVSEKGLPEDQPYRGWALDYRRRRMRNSRIYIHWMESDDKTAEIAVLSERYGLDPGRIRTIIEKMKVEGAVVASLSAQEKVLKQVRRAELIEDNNAYRSEIESLIIQLRELHENGETWLDVEVSEETGGKCGGKTVTKRVRIETEIKRLLAELAKSHGPEAQALSDYGTKDGGGGDDTAKAARANAEFVAEYERLKEKQKEGEPIETDAEIIE